MNKYFSKSKQEVKNQNKSIPSILFQNELLNQKKDNIVSVCLESIRKPKNMDNYFIDSSKIQENLPNKSQFAPITEIKLKK